MDALARLALALLLAVPWKQTRDSLATALALAMALALFLRVAVAQ